MNLAIKGHSTRCNEVIETLEMLGGINKFNLDGAKTNLYYYIDSSNNKIYCVLSVDPNDYNVYSLEEFLEKFPYKVGDKVWLHYKNLTIRITETITSMRWCGKDDCVLYDVCTCCNLKEYAFTPYKEETMEERKSINLNELEPQPEALVKEATESLNKLLDEEPQPKAPILSNRYDYAEGKCGYVIPDGYEFDSIKQGFQTEIILRPIKSQYPKTYEECCEAIGINRYDIEIDLPQTYQQKMFNLFKLLICRDAYWKIAGEEMRLDGSWEPDYITEDNQLVYIITTQRGYLSKNTARHWNYILAFPTEEMRDKFYENFKELIEQCKELL